MSNPDYKQLKENFDKFSEEIQDNTEALDENLKGDEELAKSSAFYKSLVARREQAKTAYQKAAPEHVEATHWLTGKHPQDRNRCRRRLQTPKGVPFMDNCSARGRGLRAWKGSRGSRNFGAFTDAANGWPADKSMQRYGRSPALVSAQKLLRSLQADLNLATNEKKKQSQAWPVSTMAQKYFCHSGNWGSGCELNDSVTHMKKVSDGDPGKSWQSIIWKTSKYIKYYKEYIRINNWHLANFEKKLSSSTKMMNDSEEEFKQTTQAMLTALRAFKSARGRGADESQAVKLADAAAQKEIGDYDKSKKKAAGKPKAADPTPAAKPKKTRVKVAADDPEAQSLVFENEMLTEQHEANAERRKIMSKLVDLSMEIQSALQSGEMPATEPGPEIAKLARDLVSMKRTYCDNPQQDSTTAKFCADLKSDLAQTAQTAVLLRKAKASLGKKDPGKVDMGKGRRTAKGKTSMRRGRKRKERCGKAPKGEYGSARFKPKPSRLGGRGWSKRKTQAVQERYPETKKIFDQFYADLDEFGVKITKDFWWGSAHNKAYRKILCKLDEKAAKPKEDTGEVDYKLANKYNGNRQKLGLPILTGDQLKKEYLSTLIRGGMHMGLSHEESDKLMGKRKGTAPVKKKPEKSKAVSGVEATEAVEDANAIYKMAKGWTDGEEEQRITAIVEKHLRANTIGILSNYYVRVLRQNNAMDRGDLVRELYEEDLTELARRVQQALQRQTRGQEFREGQVIPAKNKVVYGGKTFNLNKLVEHASKGKIKNFKALKYAIRKKAIVENKNSRAVHSTGVASKWVMNWLEENIGTK